MPEHQDVLLRMQIVDLVAHTLRPEGVAGAQALEVLERAKLLYAWVKNG